VHESTQNSLNLGMKFKTPKTVPATTGAVSRGDALEPGRTREVVELAVGQRVTEG